MDIAFHVHVHLKVNAGVISLHPFCQKYNFISGDKMLCKHNSKWNAYRYPSKIGWFWNAAEMKHVKRTCFHAGSKSQTGISSFSFSCECTLRANFEPVMFYIVLHERNIFLSITCDICYLSISNLNPADEFRCSLDMYIFHCFDQTKIQKRF